MVVRRSDARRRRLVVDPSQVAAEPSESGALASSSDKKRANQRKDVRAYSYGAHRRNVNKTTDLFPKRTVSYLLFVFALLVCLGLINYGAIKSPQWLDQIGSQGLSSLAISGSGTIASWFTACLLIFSSLASLQIFALRKHRCDDYRGTYRIWAWMAPVLLLASLCCIVNLASIARFAFESLAQVSFTQKPWLAPAITISLLTILIGRAVYEVRRSQGTMAWLSVAWLGYAAAALLHMPAAQEMVLMEFGAGMLVGNCVLFATAALLMGHLTYVRFIFLRAHGLIKLKVKKKKVAKPKAKAKAKVKAKAETKSKSKTKAKPKATKTAKTKSKPQEAAPAKSKKKTAAKPAEVTADQSKPAAVAAKEKKAAAKKKAAKGKSSSAQSDSEAAAKRDSKKSSRDTLKEMAAASRAKAKSKSKREVSSAAEEDYESEGIIKMSKAQRRKLRKEARNSKRAA